METADRDARQLRGMDSEPAGAASVHEVKLQRTRTCHILKRLNATTVERLDTLKKHAKQSKRLMIQDQET